MQVIQYSRREVRSMNGTSQCKADNPIANILAVLSLFLLTYLLLCL